MLEWLLEKPDVIRPSGEIEVLPYYAAVAQRLVKFLGNREIGTKVWIPNGPQLLKRGSKMEPLTVTEFVKNVNDDFIEIRKNVKSLGDAAEKLNPVQSKIWNYFLPRKLCDFFYATNFEGAGRGMDRIFYDIDKTQEIPVQDAAVVADALINHIKSDDDFNNKIGKNRLFLMFTGNSFHVYIFLRKPVNQEFYEKNIHFTKNDPLSSFTGKWAQKISEETGIKAIGGHEKTGGIINIDPSQTPSGKLARCPFSLHMGDAKTIDGVAIPLGLESIKDKNLVKNLKSYTPKKVLENLDELSKFLPKIV
jgi:DNA primase